MLKQEQIFDKLVEHFITTGELGHYNSREWSICLYNIRNTPDVLEEIKDRIGKYTTKFKFIPLEECAGRVNINILDIGL